MGQIYLYPNSLSVLAQVVSLAVVTGYLLLRPHKEGDTLMATAIYVCGLFASIFYFLSLSTVGPDPRRAMFDTWAQNSYLLLIVWGIQAPYYFHTGKTHPLRREARVALICSLILLLLRLCSAPIFHLLGVRYTYGWTIWIFIGLQTIGFSWICLTYLRRAIALSEQTAEIHWWDRLSNLQSTWARGARIYALVYALPLLGAITLSLNRFQLLSENTTNVLFGAIVTIFMLVASTTYANYSVQMHSFQFKLVYVSLLVLLVVISNVSYLITLPLERFYHATHILA
ncbi:hypothetical protein KC963_05340, partial [Candidatus Saccharibacteria bacterium]|nr:hypothetical protein [Candidatus Saccharibacteria bacterium]